MGVRVPNVSAGSDLDALVMPTRADGTLYRFEMIFRNGWDRCYDDTEAGLLGFLIDGYADLDAEGRLAARTKHAVDTQVVVQARINSLEIEPGISAADLAVLTGPRDEQPGLDEWSCDVPLVLVDIFYAPYADLSRPASTLAADTEEAPNLLWLRPAESEMAYLLSLHELGVISLSINTDEVA